MIRGVAEPPRLNPLEFIEPLVHEGSYAQANCILRKGDRPIQFTWLYNGKIINTNEDIQIDLTGRSSILTIDPVKFRHQGAYTCVATNMAGQDEYSSDLAVNGIRYYKFLANILSMRFDVN